MNTKTSLIATAASLALFSAANGQAPIVIDITGSTAGRSTVNTQIVALLSGESTAFYRTDGAATSLGSADAAIYKGGTLGGIPVTVRTFWAGSATGVDFVSNQVMLDNKFISTGYNIVTSGQQIPGDAATIQANGHLAPASAETVSEFGFSDVKQTATIYQTNPLAESTDLFVIPFRWLATVDTTGVTNITNQMVRAHYTGTGETDKSLFTGVPGDNNQVVYAVGRDNDSGTRITAFAETGAGAFATVSQWSFDTAGAQPNVVISNPLEVFDGGYASGGSVGSILSGTGFQAIGYVGISDASTAVTNGAVPLSFNGTPFSVANVQNGSYTFWSTYQMLRQQTLTGATLSLFNSLKSSLTDLATQVNGSSINLLDMQVTRQGDGADVLPN